jgi:putative ABC transport system substrate-binding protein
MKRRELIAAVGALALAPRPLLLCAQAARPRRIGILLPGGAWPEGIGELRTRLQALGWTGGANLAIELRHAENRFERYPALLQELVEREVELIVVTTTPGTRAAKKAIAATPVVFAHVADPVAAGLVESLARPGGNLTGVATLALEIAPKQIELLKALAPGLERVAELRQPGFGPIVRVMSDQLEAAARSARVALVRVEAEKAEDLEAAFASAVRARAAAMVVPPAPLYIQQSKQIALLAARHRIATVYQSRVQVAAGGLASYGVDLVDAFARTARYVDRILRRTPPADLAIEQADRFQLVINLRTARALGITIPQSVLLRADEVIE